MIEFLKNPNCPEQKIKLAFIGQAPEEIKKFIESFSIELITLNSNNKIDKLASNHADVNVLHIGNGLFVYDISQEPIFKNFSIERGAVTSFETDVCGRYPNDCKLNFALVGKNLFGKMSVLDLNVKEYGERNNWNFVDVKQGYAKCSTCVVNERAIITDDVSIHKAAIKNGIDSLLIEKGDIVLNENNYGFIGGTSCLIEKNHLLFFGDIRLHRSFPMIYAFLKEHECNYSYLSDYPLTDIGGIVSVY